MKRSTLKFMKTLFALTFLVTATTASSQDEKFQFVKDIYSNWKKSNSGKHDACKVFYYADTIDSYTIEFTQDLIGRFSSYVKYPGKDTTDRIQFDSVETKYILEQMERLNSRPWRNAIFPASRVVPFGKVDSIQRSVNEKKLDPIQRLCYTVYQFSRPIFLRNNTLCLFFSGKTDFAVKEGEFWIYRKEGNQWKKYSPVYRWVE